MSKTSHFAHGFASNIPVDGLEWGIDGKNLNIKINNENTNREFDISLNITKNHNKAELWSNGHFLARCSGDNQIDLCEKLTRLLLDEVEIQDQKQTMEEVNKELCDYLTGEFEKSGFTIINKSSTTEYGSYVVGGPSGKEYIIKATYKDSKVTVSKVDDDRDVLNETKTFELSNPDIEKVICKALLEYDQAQLSDEEKSKLKREVQNLIIDEISEFYLNDTAGEWTINCDGNNLFACETEDERFKIKFKVTGITLTECS